MSRFPLLGSAVWKAEVVPAVSLSIPHLRPSDNAKTPKNGDNLRLSIERRLSRIEGDAQNSQGKSSVNLRKSPGCDDPHATVPFRHKPAGGSGLLAAPSQPIGAPHRSRGPLTERAAPGGIQ